MKKMYTTLYLSAVLFSCTRIHARVPHTLLESTGIIAVTGFVVWLGTYMYVTHQHRTEIDALIAEHEYQKNLWCAQLKRVSRLSHVEDERTTHE